MIKLFRYIRQQLLSKCNCIVNGRSIIIVLALLMANYISSQNRVPPPPCYANGNSGFGGAVGEGQFLFWGEDTNPIIIHMNTNNISNVMDDVLVLYIDTGAPGRNEIDDTVDDNQDDHRIAITNSNMYGNGSNITFPAGFEASYAVAIDVFSGGGLYSIPNTGSVGAGELDFITSVNSTLESSTSHPYVFDFYWEDIGLTMTDELDIVGLYVTKRACNSNEGYGEGIATEADCKDDIFFTGYITLPGCSMTLGVTDNSSNTLKAYYFNDKLFIEGINEVVSIRVYDIQGRKIYSDHHQIQESVPIPLELNKNELHFIVIENANKKKVLKVISN